MYCAGANDTVANACLHKRFGPYDSHHTGGRLMPLTIGSYCDAGPFSGGGRQASHASDTLHIGLVNNMADAALEATEAQFRHLLEAAAGTMSVHLRYSFLPEIVRGPDAVQRLRHSYWPLDALLSDRLDALIVTGAEPIAPSLPEERYWRRLVEVLNWAESNTTSSIWSCLAAHAAALHLDAIPRRRLQHKCCGVFEHDVMSENPLLGGVSAPLHTPHSRWNELPLDALRATGYIILSASADTGANIFVKQRRSLLVFFQGHPEYERTTLLKEYRRDIERYASGQRAHYPTLPCGYFSCDAVATLRAFRDCAPGTAPAARPSFPYTDVAAGVQNNWHSAAVQIYGNWLSILAAARSPATVPVAPVH
jgi:homoserine O-succinyltransferase